MKKASLVINEIKENKYNDLLADIYVDATLVDTQKDRYVKAIEKFIALYGDKDIEIYIKEVIPCERITSFIILLRFL